MKIKDLFKNYIYPMSVFIGGMIGVGFLSLPYIAMKSGAQVMIFYFVFLTALVIAINLIFAEISLKTPDFKRFPGFVGYHLGKPAEAFSIVSVIFGTVGVLLIYLIVGGQFLTSALQPLFGGSILNYTFIYFFLVSLIIYFDVKVISKIEIWILALLVLSVIFLFFVGFSHVKMSHIFVLDSSFQVSNLFLPYGALLFSLWGIGLIPQIEEMIPNSKKNLKKIIVISTLSASVFYILFTFIILGITGSATTQTALVGLKYFLGVGVANACLLIGALATFVAFISSGMVFKKVLTYDLGVKPWQAFVMTCATPMILFLLGVQSFVPLISFIGGVLLSIDGILILLMYRKIKKINSPIYFLSIIFLFGIIYQIIYFTK